MFTDVASIPADGTLAKRWSGVGHKPLSDPFGERHVSLLAQVRVAIAIDSAMEQWHQLFLRFCEHGFVDRRTVIFMSDDDAPFPTSVFAFADQSVPVRSFSCHCSHLLQTTTYHNLFGISSENRNLFLVVVAFHDLLQRDLPSRAADVVDRLAPHVIQFVVIELTDLRDHAHQHLELHRVTE